MNDRRGGRGRPPRLSALTHGEERTHTGREAGAMTRHGGETEEDDRRARRGSRRARAPRAAGSSPPRARGNSSAAVEGAVHRYGARSELE